MTDAARAADIRDVPEHWPVASSAELARGSLLRMRTDTVRMPGGGRRTGRSSSTRARWPCSAWTNPAGC